MPGNTRRRAGEIVVGVHVLRVNIQFRQSINNITKFNRLALTRTRPSPIAQAPGSINKPRLPPQISCNTQPPVTRKEADYGFGRNEQRAGAAALQITACLTICVRHVLVVHVLRGQLEATLRTVKENEKSAHSQH